MKQQSNITKHQFGTLADLFTYYNTQLFDGKLPNCIVNMSRHRGANGFFQAENWKESATDLVKHEISLNPDLMNRDDKLWHSTLVHEMVHLWQQEQGSAPRRCYHDKQFAAKMKAVGLQPSNTGQPGGKETGQSMTHYIIEGGVFETAFNEIEEKDLQSLRLPYVPNIATAKTITISGGGDDDEAGEETEEKASLSGVKKKYICGCENKVWGKPGLDLHCNECNTNFTEQ